ncbi:MAG: ABC transporter substrate-binding protein [Bulleidia sp.]
MKKGIRVLCTGVIALSLTACGSATASSNGDSSENSLKKVTLMLDYTPNTNHTGIYVAAHNGYYEDMGLDVEIIEPGDNATTSMVAAGKADFGVSYQEDVTYALTSEDPLPIRAVATVIQHNTSGFVSLKSAGITSVKDFEGKTYAGWGAPSEEAVIEACMKRENADFSRLTIVGADGSGIAGLSDETGPNRVNINWEFYGWAVIRALMDGYEISYLPLAELDERLDYYTPVLITNNQMIENDPETVKAFMSATKKGYEYAIDNPDESAQILHDDALPDVDLEFLKESQAYLSGEYAKDAESWGVMKDEVWDNYTSFMYEYGLISDQIAAADQYTNDFVK